MSFFLCDIPNKKIIRSSRLLFSPKSIHALIKPFYCINYYLNHIVIDGYKKY